MSIEIFALIFILFTFAFLLSGIPAGFVLSGNALLFAILGSLIGFFDTAFLQAIPNRIFGIMSNQNLLAVPLFIFMGLILEKTKIAEELLESMNKLYSNTNGGLAISVVLVGVLLDCQDFSNDHSAQSAFDGINHMAVISRPVSVNRSDISLSGMSVAMKSLSQSREMSMSQI